MQEIVEEDYSKRKQKKKINLNSLGILSNAKGRFLKWVVVSYCFVLRKILLIVFISDLDTAR